MIFIELEVIDNNEDHEAESVRKYWHNWPKNKGYNWGNYKGKNYLDQYSSHTWSCENSAPYESLSLENKEIFGTAVHTPKGVKSVGYEWLFVRKQNEILEM